MCLCVNQAARVNLILIDENDDDDDVTIQTRSSATAEGSRDVVCQSKSCRLLRDSAEKNCTTNRNKSQ